MGRCHRVERCSPPARRRSGGELPGALRGTFGGRTRVCRRALVDRGPFDTAPVLRRLVQRQCPSTRRGCFGPLAKTPQVVAAVAVLRGDLRARGSVPRPADGPRVPTFGPASIEARPVRSRHGAFGHSPQRRSQAVRRRDRRSASCLLRRRTGPRSGPSGRRRPRDHPPLRSGQLRGLLVGFGPGHPGRTPAPFGREESPVAGAGDPGSQAGSVGLSALAPVPGQDEAARRAPPAPGPWSTSRSKSASAPWW